MRSQSEVSWTVHLQRTTTSQILVLRSPAFEPAIDTVDKQSISSRSAGAGESIQFRYSSTGLIFHGVQESKTARKCFVQNQILSLRCPPYASWCVFDGAQHRTRISCWRPDVVVETDTCCTGVPIAINCKLLVCDVLVGCPGNCVMRTRKYGLLSRKWTSILGSPFNSVSRHRCGCSKKVRDCVHCLATVITKFSLASLWSCPGLSGSRAALQRTLRNQERSEIAS
jgi:hypothetical protein